MATPARRGFGRRRRKYCRFCREGLDQIPYTDGRMLRNFLTERGKIVPRRISGNCAKHQRQLTTSIKRARIIALLPFVAD